MADIASGHGNALWEHGMTASHRDTALGLIAGDSEQYRPGTTGHYHGER
jgi:hypothetical protein